MAQGVCACGLRFGLAPENHGVACPTAFWPHASLHIAQAAAWRHRECPGPQPTPQPKTGLSPSSTAHCWVQSCRSSCNAGGPEPCKRDALTWPGNVLVGGCAILRDPWPPGHIAEPSGPYSGDPSHPGEGAPCMDSLPCTHVIHWKCTHWCLGRMISSESRPACLGAGQQEPLLPPRVAHSQRSLPGPFWEPLFLPPHRGVPGCPSPRPGPLLAQPDQACSILCLPTSFFISAPRSSWAHPWALVRVHGEQCRPVTAKHRWGRFLHSL